MDLSAVHASAADLRDVAKTFHAWQDIQLHVQASLFSLDLDRGTICACVRHLSTVQGSVSSPKLFSERVM